MTINKIEIPEKDAMAEKFKDIRKVGYYNAQ
jgi:hypothetical protein